MVHHQWQAGGIGSWDNPSTQHHAVADEWPHERVNHRVTFDAPTAIESETPNAERKPLKAEEVA